MVRTIALLGFAAAVVATMPLAAQTPEKPLGDLLESLPLSEQPSEPQPAVDPAPRPEPPPEPEPGRVGAIDLPPSAPDENAPAPHDPADAPTAPAVTPAPSVTPADPATAEADAAWSAIQERRRQEINAVEAPQVARLNAEQAARQAAARQAAEQAQADYRDSLARRDNAIREAEAAHAAELARHRERAAREQAEYQARVAACLDGDRAACAPPGTPR